MNRLDLIIDALECAKQQTIKGVMYPAGYHMMLAQALAAARELRELKPVAWIDEGFIEWENNHSQFWAEKNHGTKLYALDEVTK